MMYKIIHELVELFPVLQRKHEHVTVMRINSRCPLALRMPLNSPFSRGPLGSGIRLPAKVTLSPSLAVFKERATTFLNYNSN